MRFSEIDRFNEIDEERLRRREWADRFLGLAIRDQRQALLLVLDDAASPHDPESIIAVAAGCGRPEIIDVQRGSPLVVKFQDERSIVLLKEKYKRIKE